MSVHDTQNPESRDAALTAATDAVRDGKLIVLPTDTVYGIGADAFTPDAVNALLDAKGRGRDVPPPVLVGDHAVLLALATDVPDYVEQLAEEFWPGPLTIILTAQPSLTWDLGETRGTVALRMPDDEIALALLRRTGPLAVSSANRSGKPAALTVLDAATQLGDSVEEYLDGGTARIGTSSTILDATVEPAEIVREGSLTKEQIIAAVGDIFAAPVPEVSEDDADVEGSPEAADDGSLAEGASADGALADGSAADLSAADHSAADGTASDDTAPDGGAPQGDSAGDSPAESSRATPAETTGAAAGAPALDLPSEPDLGRSATTPAEAAVPAVPADLAADDLAADDPAADDLAAGDPVAGDLGADGATPTVADASTTEGGRGEGHAAG
ncbi:L-threonylcarbamoyladenylate synthase [Brachybacterium tyrofermentans]|uniref:L-threonylcarbamoyladenylate synthase n=1 Tax=Brachybacterium tyrofermentans TaxID=47848 RepID=UPI003F8E21EC